MSFNVGDIVVDGEHTGEVLRIERGSTYAVKTNIRGDYTYTISGRYMESGQIQLKHLTSNITIGSCSVLWKDTKILYSEVRLIKGSSVSTMYGLQYLGVPQNVLEVLREKCFVGEELI